jgi:hypothetical protein
VDEDPGFPTDLRPSLTTKAVRPRTFKGTPPPIYFSFICSLAHESFLLISALGLPYEMRTNTSLRRILILYVLPGALLTLFLISSFRHLSQHTQDVRAKAPQHGSSGSSAESFGVGSVSTEHLLTGKAIAPKLGNETAKAELGRAAWRLFHTTFARFPDKPTTEESEALRTYLGLFQRLYPW